MRAVYVFGLIVGIAGTIILLLRKPPEKTKKSRRPPDHSLESPWTEGRQKRKQRERQDEQP